MVCELNRAFALIQKGASMVKLTISDSTEQGKVYDGYPVWLDANSVSMIIGLNNNNGTMVTFTGGKIIVKEPVEAVVKTVEDDKIARKMNEMVEVIKEETKK